MTRDNCINWERGWYFVRKSLLSTTNYGMKMFMTNWRSCRIDMGSAYNAALHCKLQSHSPLSPSRTLVTWTPLSYCLRKNHSMGNLVQNWRRHMLTIENNSKQQCWPSRLNHLLLIRLSGIRCVHFRHIIIMATKIVVLSFLESLIIHSVSHVISCDSFVGK